MAVQGCTRDCARSSTTVIRLLELKSALTQFKLFLCSSFPFHLVWGPKRDSLFALRRPHSRRQAEEFNQHHHGNRHFQNSTTPQILDQQQSRSLSPVPNSKSFCVIYVCLFFNAFHIFSFAHIFNACLSYLQSVNFTHHPGPKLVYI